jgi:hypothetical protein
MVPTSFGRDDNASCYASRRQEETAMTVLLAIVASCAFGAFLIACTDVPKRRTFGHTLRSSLLLMGFVVLGLPLLIFTRAPHTLAVPLGYAAFLAWVAVGTLWSMRLDPGAALRPLPQWVLRPWWVPDWIVWSILLSATLVLFLSGAGA